MSERLAPALREMLAAGEPVALVTVARAAGSTPREGGARMLVTDRGVVLGTVGGGRLEWEAIARARALLAAGEAEAGLDLPLGPAVGQCCGGHVTLAFRRAGEPELAQLEAREANEAAALPVVLLFGAGHVGKALARALAPLPLRVRWIDGRADQFPDQPVGGAVEAVVTERLVDEAEQAPPGAAHLVLTHSHTLDFAVCEALLRRGDFAYLGLIGSGTKRARFERGFRDLGIAEAALAHLTCPIGGDRLRDKRPAVIAALAAAEILLTLGNEAAASRTRAETRTGKPR